MIYSSKKRNLLSMIRKNMNKKNDFNERYKFISVSDYPFFFQNALTIELAEKVGISFNMENNKLIANIPFFETNIKFNIDRESAVTLLFEQFVCKSSYNFILHNPTVVVDIGMSVGDTTLAFAANPNVVKVFAYELMPQIYERAKFNLSLNPDISFKADVRNYGLGKESKDIEVEYYDELDLSNGIYNDSRKEIFKDGVNSKVIIKEIVNELQLINKDFGNFDLCLKIDAEGAEYEIIEAIFNSGINDNIRYIALEYHFGVKNIIEILRNHNYEIISSITGFDLDCEVGLIQAIRK